MAEKSENKSLAENRKARHDYFLIEGFEAGIELVGTEVKSIRNGRANLKDSYAEIRNGEVFIRNMNISHYEQGNIYNKDPIRDRKLLLHKSEILKLIGFTAQDGYTLIPVSLYLKNSRVKVHIAVAKGKKNYDKRDTMLENAAKRDIAREYKERLKL